MLPPVLAATWGKPAKLPQLLTVMTTKLTTENLMTHANAYITPYLTLLTQPFIYMKVVIHLHSHYVSFLSEKCIIQLMVTLGLHSLGFFYRNW